MLTKARQSLILERVKAEGFVKNTDLEKELNTSISTIRRDLIELEEAHLLKRVHGGAQSLTALAEEPSILEKSSKNVQAKQKIAHYAANLIQPDSIIFLDAGTATFEMITYLPKHITVVTNSILHGNALAEADIPTYMIGGMIRPRTRAVVNTTAYQQLSTMQFDQAFIGVNGIDLAQGFTTPDPNESQLKALAIKQSAHSFILGDASKFGHSSFMTFASFEEATLLTDNVPEKWRSLLSNDLLFKEVDHL